MQGPVLTYKSTVTSGFACYKTSASVTKNANKLKTVSAWTVVFVWSLRDRFRDGDHHRSNNPRLLSPQSTIALPPVGPTIHDCPVPNSSLSSYNSTIPGGRCTQYSAHHPHRPDHIFSSSRMIRTFFRALLPLTTLCRSAATR